MAWWDSLNFQNGASPLMEQLITFHDHAMVILILIMIFVSHIMFSMLYNVFIHRLLLQHQTIELIWTALPAIILLFLAFPSLRLLYLMDEINHPCVTIKVIGKQWNWIYNYSNFSLVKFSSFMVPTNKLDMSGGFRLLETDNHMVIPAETQMRVLVTSKDVIHSWSVPSLGVKADAIPGRLNQLSFTCTRVGLFYGQCSEICGANHSFMPITVESVPLSSFVSWVKTY
uniref:Cytochrome c oxidase subunit 2 n=1 Tax=Glyptonotus cf. antarcticus FK-2009 TaxID=692432 RepID=E3SX98_9CRUS|nr:cytochrome c oxidase subunit II [Glyptonotus cf. antarcticus FK-2009]